MSKSLSVTQKQYAEAMHRPNPYFRCFDPNYDPDKYWAWQKKYAGVAFNVDGSVDKRTIPCQNQQVL